MQYCVLTQDELLTVFVYYQAWEHQQKMEFDGLGDSVVHDWSLERQVRKWGEKKPLLLCITG